MNTPHTGHAVAEEISRQIGQRAFLMMGASGLVSDVNSLSFSIRGCKTINKVRVRLDPCDTYSVIFYKVRGLDSKTVAIVEGIYADGLHQVIESKTGLRLSL